MCYFGNSSQSKKLKNIVIIKIILSNKINTLGINRNPFVTIRRKSRKIKLDISLFAPNVPTGQTERFNHYNDGYWQINKLAIVWITRDYTDKYSYSKKFVQIFLYNSLKAKSFTPTECSWFLNREKLTS